MWLTGTALYRARWVIVVLLLDDLGNLTCTYRTATFADRETQTYVDSNRVDELYGNRGVVTGHYHVHAFRKLNLTGYVERTEVELRTVFVVERSVPTSLVFLQDVDLSLEFGVRSDRAGFATTIPRFTSFLSIPRMSRPTLSPASPSSRSLRNISTPVQVEVRAFSP